MDAPIARRTDGAEEGLVRGISGRSLTANIFNLTVGSGIFVLPAAVAAILGPASVLGYVACAFCVGLVGLCYAELGSRVSSGSAAMSSMPLGLWALHRFSCAAIAVIVVDSVTASLGFEQGGVMRAPLLVVLLASLAIANVRGVRTGARLVEVVTAAKLAPLLFLVVLGLFQSAPRNLVWTGLPSIHDIARATFILVFAFTGTEGALTASGEVQDPTRTIPRAIFSGLLIVAATLHRGAPCGARHPRLCALSAEQRAPLAAAAGRASGAVGRQLILAGTVISAFGYLIGNILAAPRMLFAFARDGVLPSRFGAVHPRYRTPHVAIATHAALACAFALTGTFRALAVLSVAPTLLVLLGCCLATLVLRRRNVTSDGAPFRIPAGPVVPIVAVGFILWLLSSAHLVEVLVVAALLAIATAVYALRRGRTLDV